MTRPRLEFWFEFASTYSYLSVLRLPALARTARVDVWWRPFLLGPVFAAQGWQTSPFRIYPAKGRYMWRDMARRAARQGVPFRTPQVFPQNGLLAARVAQLALATPCGVNFCQSVFTAQFADGHDISKPDTIRACLAACGLSDQLIDRADSADNKRELRKTTDMAMSHGIFGAPSFRVEDELFWGDDRLEDALEWAVRHG